jgi:DNA-binding transcriptional LysR family regulator
MSGTIDLNEMAVFAKVVQAGSFVGAARELAMPKSTVSRKVSELESRLGARLLHRTTRKLSLTEAGSAYYRHAVEVVAMADQAERAVTELQQTPRGLLRVTSPLNVGYLGPIVSRFLLREREVQIELVCTDRVVNLVEEGFDVAIRAGKLADSSLIARSLGFMQSYVVASPGFLKRNGTPRLPADLERLDCVIFGASPERNTWTLQSPTGEARIAVRGRMVVNDFDILHECALAGLGVAVLPVHRCADDLREKRLRRVLDGWCTREIQMHAIYASTRHVSPAIKAFLDHVQREMEHGPWTKLSRARTLKGS